MKKVHLNNWKSLEAEIYFCPRAEDEQFYINQPYLHYKNGKIQDILMGIPYEKREAEFFKRVIALSNKYYVIQGMIFFKRETRWLFISNIPYQYQMTESQYLITSALRVYLGKTSNVIKNVDHDEVYIITTMVDMTGKEVRKFFLSYLPY